ncbi:MAG: uridine kinase [Planctomycetia bacterium]|nr:uridine kinase [Planctomycetia bacterium]
MIGDVLLVNEKHTRVASQLAVIIEEKNIIKFIVAIAGESGTGKSEVAHELRKKLKKDGYLVKIIHSDNYYKILPTVRIERRKKYGIQSVGENEYDWEVLNKNIDDFRQGKESVLPYYDLYTNQKDRLITNFDSINILIVEGLYCLRVSSDLKVFIDSTYKDHLQAQVLRGKEPQTKFRTKVLQRESQVIQSHRSLADLLINQDYDVTK